MLIKVAPGMKVELKAYFEHTLNLIINSSPPGQNGRYFADDIFRCIYQYETFFILIKISLKFVPKVPINNNPALI